MPRITARTINRRSVVVRFASFVAAVCLAVSWAVVFPREASACSCGGMPTESAADRADAIFTGRVIEKSAVRKPKPGRTDIRFDVSRVYKGSVYRQQVVASPKGADGCGIDPDVNSTWLIFAEERIEGSGNEAVFRLVTQLCSGNLPGTSVPSELGPGLLPIQGASDREERSVNTDATFTRVLKLTAGGVGVLAVLAGVGLVFLWRPTRRGP